MVLLKNPPIKRKDLIKMNETLIKATDIAVANYILEQAEKWNVKLDNFELSADLAMLEGWSLDKYGKHLCDYGNTGLYFEAGDLWKYKDTSILEVNVAATFAGYNCNQITEPYVEYRKHGLELKPYIQRISKKEQSKEHFPEFRNQVIHLLFYRHVADHIFIPMIKQLKVDHSTQDIDSDIESVIKDVYKNNYKKIVAYSKQLELQFSKVTDGTTFDPGQFQEVFNNETGQEIATEMNDILVTKNPSSQFKYIKMLDIVKMAYNLGKHNAQAKNA